MSGTRVLAHVPRMAAAPHKPSNFYFYTL